MNAPRNTDDVIDSRDVIARIEELEGEQEEREELDTLRAFAKEAEDCSADWQDGATLVRDSYFENYAQELADELGAIDAKASWPLTCIDWTQAARELQYDYTSVEFDGVLYWVR